MQKTFALIALLLLVALPASAKTADDVCPRPAGGSVVTPAPDLYSQNGTLNVALNYNTTVDDQGHTLFCFATADGQESPTLHVNPGDTLKISLTNNIPPPVGGPAEIISNAAQTCGDATMTVASVNMHFHGTNVAPKCHGDEVIHTLVNSGETFTYTIKIPADEPPGLYWYHPHVHTLSESALQGGASGVIEVEGIANLQPAVAGLPQRILTIRDQLRQDQKKRARAGYPPTWDISLNYVPIIYPDYAKPIIQTAASQPEFWRVTNASADTVADLQVKYDNQAQTLQVVAFDGVPTGSQDGKRQGKILNQKHILLPPGGRAEFILTTPAKSVKKAEFITRTIDTGHFGDKDEKRVLARIKIAKAPLHLPRIAGPSGPPKRQRFENLADVKPTTQRLLYFSEDGTNYYITVDGQKEQVFDPNNPPAITTNQGAVEDWTIENRTAEVHDFHIHQVHFLLEAVNGVAVSKKQQQFYDTYQVPYWIGGGDYPSITVRMDFRGAVVGDFVYHCHILKHEDRGMMAIIRVLPKGKQRGAVRHAESAKVKTHAG